MKKMKMKLAMIMNSIQIQRNKAKLFLYFILGGSRKYADLGINITIDKKMFFLGIKII